MVSSASAAEIRVHRQITAAIAVGVDLKPLLSRITRAAARSCRSDMAAITLLSANGEELELVGLFGTDAPVLGAKVSVAGSLNGLVIASGRIVRSADALHDSRPVIREIPRLSGARGMLMVPLRDSRGPFGTLGVAKRRPWRFTDRDAALLTQLADSASIAIQNAQLRNQAARKPPLMTAGIAERGQTLRKTRIDQPPSLSDRQAEVLQLLIAGKTCKEVAAALGLSPRTVEHHVQRLKKHFRQPRLHALVGYAVAHGL